MAAMSASPSKVHHGWEFCALCQCPVVRLTSTHEFQSGGTEIELNLRLHLSHKEILRDKLVTIHPMLPLRERPAEAFQLSAGAPSKIQLDNEVVHAPAAAGVRVKLDLLAVGEIRAATPQVVGLSPQLKPPDQLQLPAWSGTRLS